MQTISLPRADGTTMAYRASETPIPFQRRRAAEFSRVAFAAAHVVVDPRADNDPWLECAIDWERTEAFRTYLWDLGFGVADAMDTAQRGGGLDWTAAKALISHSQAAAGGRPDAMIAYGVGTDHLLPGSEVTTDDVIAAYETQLEFVEAHGGRVILMASRALAAAARGRDDYIRVYDRIQKQTASPVILHWLGEMFDPALTGYWGNSDHEAAMDTALQVIAGNVTKVDGIKISLLSAEKEIAMRRRLPSGVRMYTGDDFNYAELIAGDTEGHSDALLGIFDAIAPAASLGLAHLASGDVAAFHSVLQPTVALSRHIFKAPTRFYKTGVVFLAWLNGFQDHFTMLGGQQSARSMVHFAELFRLADQARCLRDPDLATRRMVQLLAIGGCF